MIENWADICTLLASKKPESNKPSVKVFKRVILDIDDMNQFTLEQVGYSQTRPTKFKQLLYYYYNTESIDYAKKSLLCKGDVSTGILLQNNRKTFTSQDYCMQSLVITRTKGKYRVLVLHRNTEIIKKFIADIVFIKKILYEVGVDNCKLTFILENVSLTALCYPLLVPYQADWKKELEKIKRKDIKFYRNIIRWSYKLLYVKQTYRSVKRVQQSIPRIFTPALLQDFKQLIKEEYNENL